MSISTRAARVVQAFDDAARDWGWASDQGSGTHPQRAYEAHAKARAALVRMIRRLERRTQ